MYRRRLFKDGIQSSASIYSHKWFSILVPHFASQVSLLAIRMFRIYENTSGLEWLPIHYVTLLIRQEVRRVFLAASSAASTAHKCCTIRELSAKIPAKPKIAATYDIAMLNETVDNTRKNEEEISSQKKKMKGQMNETCIHCYLRIILLAAK